MVNSVGQTKLGAGRDTIYFQISGESREGWLAKQAAWAGAARVGKRHICLSWIGGWRRVLRYIKRFATTVHFLQINQVKA